MSQRIKRCRCGHANAEHDAFCVQCGQPILDLVAVPLVPTPTPASSSAAPTPAPATTTPAVPRKVCPLCGTINESYSLLCCGAGCGNDLSAVTPSGGAATPAPAAALAATPAAASPSAPTLHLTVGARQFECRDGDIIGREGTVGCQIFAGLGTVSRRHVALAQRDGQWFLTALANVQNTTQLDGRELPRGLPQPLTGDHSLRLSTQCEVRLQVGAP